MYNTLTTNQIAEMTADQCFKALNYIELSAKVVGKELTAKQKKIRTDLEKRLDVLMPDD